MWKDGKFRLSFILCPLLATSDLGQTPSESAKFVHVRFYQTVLIHSLLQRLLQELRDSYAIDKNAPPFLYINGRKVPLTRPEEICRALCQQILSKDFDIWLNNQSTATRDKVLDNLQGTSLALGSQSKVISCTNTGALQTPRGSLSAALKNILRKDENNFDRNLKNVGVLFAALKPVDRKPVLVIGTMRHFAARQIEN